MRLWRIWVVLRETAAVLPRELARLARRRHGTAQGSLCKPWRRNVGGRRSVAEAINLARAWGILVEEDVRVAVGQPADDWLNSLGADVDASYAAFTSNRSYTWEGLLIRGKIVVKLRSGVLDSDEGILDVLGHEMHEINSLRGMFDQRGQIPGSELIRLTEVGRSGNLHDQAWHVGARVVGRFRGGLQ